MSPIKLPAFDLSGSESNDGYHAIFGICKDVLLIGNRDAALTWKHASSTVNCCSVIQHESLFRLGTIHKILGSFRDLRVQIHIGREAVDLGPLVQSLMSRHIDQRAHFSFHR